MPPPWIVEAVDIFEQGGFGLAAGMPSMAPDQLRLQCFEKSFGHRIILAISRAAH